MGWNLTASDTNHGNPYGTNDPNRLDNSPARGQHTECTSCHGWDDSGGNYEGATKHTNDSITMNSDLSYNDADGSCGSNCHGGYTDIAMTPLSEWPNDTVAAGAVSCGSCHGDPASVGGVDRTTESATHAAHGATSGELVAENEAVCEQCHPTVDYQSGHSGALSLDPAKVSYSGGANGTCTTSSCHNQAADESNAWDSATQLECNDCHGDASGGLSSSHTKHFSKGYDCDSCHSKPGAGNTLHANDGTTLADRSVADQDEAEVTEGTWNDGTDSCSNTACHNPSGASYAATWQVTTAGCTTCHSDSDPATGDHTKHIDASTLFGIDTVSCVSCHPDNTLTSHTTGAVLFSGVSYAGATTGCGTNTCHNDGVDQSTGTPRTSPYAWDDASAIGDCTECHGNDASSMASYAHTEHLQYASPQCTECHTGATATTHIDGTVNFDAGSVTYGETATVGNGTYSTCTTSACHNQSAASVAWDTTGQLTCDSCHPDSSGNGLSASHDAHLTFGKACSDCHTVPTDTTHIDNRASIAMTDGANASAGEPTVTMTDMDFGTPTCYLFTERGLRIRLSRDRFPGLGCCDHGR
jgi:predicted CxxxxCH...CXXCH cytochrome family protein